MNAYKAIFEMNPGDIFRTNSDDWVKSEAGMLERVGFREDKLCLSTLTLELEGEIIRAEPEVLTYRDWFVKNSPGVQAENAFIDGDKNGQIKEWKRLKPLIDDALENSSSITEVRQKLKNLTPPWEIEKND